MQQAKLRRKAGRAEGQGLPTLCKTQAGSVPVGTGRGLGKADLRPQLQGRVQPMLLETVEHGRVDTHLGFALLLSLYHSCLSTDRPPSGKVSQQPPVPPQRPMAALPPLPVSRNHSVGRAPPPFPDAAWCLTPLFTLPESKESFKHFHLILIL